MTTEPKPNNQVYQSAYELIDFSANYYAHTASFDPEYEARQLQIYQETLVTLPDGVVTISDTTLGRGAFGTVFMGEYQGQLVAVKEFAPTSELGLNKVEALQAFEWETSRLSALHHPNLVRFYGVYQNRREKGKEKKQGEGCLCMIMELCHNQNLAKRLTRKASQLPQSTNSNKESNPYDSVDMSIAEPASTQNKSQYQVYEPSSLPEPMSNNPSTGDRLTLPEEKPAIGRSTFWRVALDMAHGLAYLHGQGTLHRDLKSENVLFDFNGRAKLADLGVAQVDELLQSSEAQILSRNLKDYSYAAPEEFKGNTTAKSDMFSYGLVLCEMLQSRTLGNCSRREAGKLETIPSTCPESIRVLIEACWQADPDQRPTTQEVIELLESCYMECGVSEWDILLPRLERELEPQQAALLQYVPSFVEDQGITIQTALNSFLRDQKYRVLVVAGEGGLGKSLSTYDLANRLIESHRQRQPDQTGVDHSNPNSIPSWLPILIRPAIPQWQHSALQDGFAQALIYYGLPQASFDSSGVRSQQLVFILDGHDELSGDDSVGNLPTLLGLQEFPNAKLVISTRSTSIGTSKLSKILGFNGSPAQICQLLPFTADQRLAFLRNSLQWDGEEQERFSDQLSKAPELAESLKNPFVLQIFAKSWETQKKQNLQSLTRHEIYEMCIRHWVTTSSPSLPLPLYKQLLGDDPLQSAKDWLVQSAFMMAKNGTLSLPLEALQTTASAAWSSARIAQTLNAHAAQQFQLRLDTITAKQRSLSLAANPEERNALAQELKNLKRRALLSLPQYQSLLLSRAQRFLNRSPLKQRNGRLQFIHKSLWEYCTASGIHHSLAYQTDQPDSALRLGLTPDFILQDTSVLSFLQQLTSVQDHGHWESWLEASKHHINAAPVAACAITALNGLQMVIGSHGYRFPSNLCGIRIPGADLQGAILDSIQFDEADLSRVQFTGAWLSNASAARAQFNGVRLGESPMLKQSTEVHQCCFSPDGSQLLITQGNLVKVYQTETHSFAYALKEHTEIVSTIGFSPNGQYFASGGLDHLIYLYTWDANTSLTLRRKLLGHTGAVRSVAFSADGTCIASGSEDKSVRLWTVAGKLRQEIRQTSEIRRITLSPDGNMVASGSQEGVQLLDVKTDTKLLREIEAEGAIFNHDGSSIVCWSYRSMSLWDIASDSLLWEVPWRCERTSLVFEWSPNGRYIISRDDSLVCLWDASGVLLRELKGHHEIVSTAAFSPDGKYIVSGGGLEVILWEVSIGAWLRKNQNQSSAVHSVACSPDGRLITSGSENGWTQLWDAASGKLLQEMKDSSQINSVAFGPEGKYVAGGCEHTIRLHAASGELLLDLSTTYSTDRVHSVALSANGLWIAAGSDAGVRVWDMTGILLWTDDTHNNYCVVFSPDSKLIATGNGLAVTLSNPATGAKLNRLTVGEAQSIVFSPDGRNIAVGCDCVMGPENGIWLWDGSKNSPQRITTEYSNSISWSPDGRYIASSRSGWFGGKSPDSSWNLVELLDVRRRKFVHSANCGSYVHCVYWNPQPTTQGLFLATSHEDCSVRYWRFVNKPGEKRSLQLIWSSLRLPLMASQFLLAEPQGLSKQNASLLEQRGAITQIWQQQPEQGEEEHDQKQKGKHKKCVIT